MKKLREILGGVFESDHARATRHLKEVAAASDAQYTEFVAKAREAGFTGPQADFMWTYLSLNNHVHEYRHPEGGWRPLTNPPLNRKNI